MKAEELLLDLYNCVNLKNARERDVSCQKRHMEKCMCEECCLQRVNDFFNSQQRSEKDK